MTKLNDTPAWKTDYLEKNGVEQNFLTGDDFAAFLDEMNVTFETVMREYGLIS